MNVASDCETCWAPNPRRSVNCDDALVRLIHVHTEWGIDNIYTLDAGESLTLRLGDPVVLVTIERLAAPRSATSPISCTASAVLELPADLEASFDGLALDEVPVGSRRHEDLDKLQGVSLPWGLYPQNLRRFTADAQAKLSERASAALRLLRWRTGASGGPQPMIGRLTHQWSWDGNHWRPLASHTHIHVTSTGVPRLTDAHRVSVEEMFAAGIVEPASEELLREASAQRTANPRSALVLAVAAAEVGFKELIADLVPAASWLAIEVPAPPLLNMLIKYLPTLPVRLDAPASRPPKPLVRVIERAVGARNDLIHQGVGTPAIDDLDAAIDAVEALLSQFARYRGYDWASSWEVGEPRR
jgi:hypothetical protein